MWQTESSRLIDAQGTHHSECVAGKPEAIAAMALRSHYFWIDRHPGRTQEILAARHGNKGLSGYLTGKNSKQGGDL